MTAAADDDPTTYHAPAARAPVERLSVSRDALARSAVASALLDAMPGMALVLNAHRQVVGANAQVLAALGVDSVDAVLGARPGELFACVNADEGPGGCGTSPNCETCGAVNAVLQSLRSGRAGSGECRLVTRQEADGGAVDVFVRSNVVELDGERLVVASLTDISGDKRRKVLERLFFHDLLNAAGGIQGLSELLLSDVETPQLPEYLGDVQQLSAEMVEQIQGHRQMLAAERGELALACCEVEVSDLVRQVATSCRHLLVARDRGVRLGEVEAVSLRTDPVLLRRVLVNLTKNALEAIPTGGEVTLGVVATPGGGAAFRVHNPGVMADWVQKQIFQRSFSTKAGDGRGVGTHSVRLFTERYLGGRVTFVSRAPEGTTFTVTLPAKLEGET